MTKYTLNIVSYTSCLPVHQEAPQWDYGTVWFMTAEAAQGKPIQWHFLPCVVHGTAAATEGQGSGSPDNRDKMAFLN